VPPAPPPTPIHVTPACDLAPAAGLEWIVEMKPRAIAQTLDLVPAIALVVPETRLDAFAAGHGGVDLRQTEERAANDCDCVICSENARD